jgi:hypothetical protein
LLPHHSCLAPLCCPSCDSLFSHTFRDSFALTVCLVMASSSFFFLTARVELFIT